MYHKNPKNSDNQNICCNHPKNWTKRLYHRLMHPKDAEDIANSVDPDQRSSLSWVCTVCPALSVWKLRVITIGVILFESNSVCFQKKFYLSFIHFWRQTYTGDSRYIAFAYLDTITLKWCFIPNIYSLYIFAFQLHLCWKWLTWSNGYLDVIFHPLDVFSIIFATAYVEVKNRGTQWRGIVCFGYVHVLPEVWKSSNQQSKTISKW